MPAFSTVPSETARTQPAEDKEIIREIDRARSQVSLLIGGLSHLSDRLTPVMRMDSADEDSTKPMEIGTNTQLGHSIRTISMDLETINDSVLDMLNRLELP